MLKLVHEEHVVFWEDYKVVIWLVSSKVPFERKEEMPRATNFKEEEISKITRRCQSRESEWLEKSLEWTSVPGEMHWINHRKLLF